MRENSFTVKVGPLMITFDSFDQWVNCARSLFEQAKEEYRTHKYICVDTKGRICVSGAEFMRARDDGSFPVKVYSLELPKENKNENT